MDSGSMAGRFPRRWGRNSVTHTMERFETTEAPVTTEVEPDDFTGHYEDRPVEMAVDIEDDDVDVTRSEMGFKRAVVNMSPAEVYHLVDDLLNGADLCWGAYEQVVTAVRPDGGEESYLATVKAATPEEAVENALEYNRAIADVDGHVDQGLAQSRLDVLEKSGGFRTYRADTMATVSPDSVIHDDPETNDQDDN